MRKVSLLFFVLFLGVLIIPNGLFGQVVNAFDAASADTNFWAYFAATNAHYGANGSAAADKGYINLSYVAGQVDNAMQIDYHCHNAESWGGYTKLEHWNPDSNATYDWSAYDSISFWYNNLTACSIASRIHLRLNLHDVSNSANGAATYDVGAVEYYYSFHYILDAAAGWNKITLPLQNNLAWDGTGFNLTGWSGISGNQTLDLDQIKGYSLEFSISGGGEGDDAGGTVLLDNLVLTGLKAVPMVVYFGTGLPSRLSSFTWGQSSLLVEEGAGLNGHNALKWTQGDEWGNGWSGAGFNVSPTYNLAGGWATDSLHLIMKVDAGTAAMRMQFEDGTAKVGHTFTPIDDGAWHEYNFRLNEFVYEDGTSNFDSSSVSVFQFMGEGAAIAGKNIWFAEIWTGNPTIDIDSPEPPTNLAAFADAYYNVITWDDTPGENGETYTIYASTSPITDLAAITTDLVIGGVGENVQSATHRLYYPLVDANMTYYYAATCTDASGNVSATFATSATSTTNLAKGIATISQTPPASFVADGDLSEWSAIQAFNISPVTGHIPTGTVTDANDLSADVYLAVDDSFLYVALDVTDDAYYYGDGNWYDQDAFQMFFGLFDARGPKHTAILRGAEPDYIAYMTQNTLQLDSPTNTSLAANNTTNYFFDAQTPYWVAEAKISLDTLAAKGSSDTRFHPQRGMRIPIDLYFHDNDGSGWEGNMGFSPVSTDYQWQNPGEWAYTWIGDTTFVGVGIKAENGGSVAEKYSLSQNYPNPFNPSTTIAYSIAKPELVRVNVYNLMGQLVTALVNERQTAGSYRLIWNAENIPSGIYFYRIQAGEFTQTRKMFLVK